MKDEAICVSPNQTIIRGTPCIVEGIHHPTIVDVPWTGFFAIGVVIILILEVISLIFKGETI